MATAALWTWGCRVAKQSVHQAQAPVKGVYKLRAAVVSFALGARVLDKVSHSGITFTFHVKLRCPCERLGSL